MIWWLKTLKSMFNNIQSAIEWLEVQIKFKPKTDLNRMKEAYRLLDLSLDGIKKIHVAGTNGKGSVCSYLSQVLIEAGYKVGTFTSPYLVSFNERIRYQMKEIDNQSLLTLTNKIYQFNEDFFVSYGERLSFFELLTLMSFIYFQEKSVDVMVIEVGLGGLLDATNVLNYDLSLITSIGFDHMKQLGYTLESIASNKLGILKKGNHLITTVQKDLHPFFIQKTKEIGSTLEIVTDEDIVLISDDPIVYIDKNVRYELFLKGSYQILNSLLAIRAIQYLFPNIFCDIIQKGLRKTLWSGRLEEIDFQVYIDGAHNTHAMDALYETARTTFKDKDVWVLFSALGDKDILGMLDIVKKFAKRIVITSFPDPRSTDLSELTKPYDYIPQAMNAIEKLKKEMTANTVLIITGSLHFVGYIKKNYDRTC